MAGQCRPPHRSRNRSRPRTATVSGRPASPAGRTLVTGPGRPRPGGPGDYASSDNSTNRGLRNHGTGPEARTPPGGTSPSPAPPPAGPGDRAPRTGAGPRAARCRARPPPEGRARPPGQQRGRGQQAQAEAGGPAAGHPRPAPGLRGHDGLGRGGAGGRDHRGAGRREGQQRLEQQHLLHAGHRGAGLGGARRDQHPRVRLQHRRGQLAVGAGDSPHHPVQPAPDDPRRQVTGHALLRRRVLPVLRRRTVGH